MNQFNFKSQICTDRIQSERLLALGLKKETADMAIEQDTESTYEAYYISAYPPSKRDIPAWSLHRLFQIYTKGVISSSWNMAKFNWDDLIDCIEDSIVKGYFPKEYLV